MGTRPYYFVFILDVITDDWRWKSRYCLSSERNVWRCGIEVEKKI
jgi:hypothetical protein